MNKNSPEFHAASNRLSAGAYVALLPNRALQLLALENITRTQGSAAPGTPGLRGLLSALGVVQAPASLRAQTLGAGAAPLGHYYVALELCFWQVEMGGARWMAHAEGIKLSAAERAETTAALANLFASADAQLIAHSGGELSLLCDASTPAVQAAFPDEALGCELKNMLPNPKVWQRYLNEAQMLLANLPVNRALTARGEAAVNSVWFWGPQAVATDLPPLAVRYHGDDPILQALSLSDASSPGTPHIIQIDDYRALFGTELAAAVAALPPAAKLWLNDGRVFQRGEPPGFLRGLWRVIAAKVQGGSA